MAASQSVEQSKEKLPEPVNKVRIFYVDCFDKFTKNIILKIIKNSVCMGPTQYLKNFKAEFIFW